MSLLALLMGAVIITGTNLVQYWNQPLDIDIVEQVSTQTIHHSGFSDEDQRQLMVQKAYELGWMDFVLMIECESWFNPKARGDSGRAYWLCQMNSRWHDVSELYMNSWEEQIRVCYNKWSTHTRFYWPDRIINWMKCKEYVRNRFIFK